MKFIGNFNKSSNLIESKLMGEFGFTLEFDEKIYAKVEKDIIATLGKKEKYLGIDAYRYFRERYLAFPIELTRFYDFIDTTDMVFTSGAKIVKDTDIDALCDETGAYYHYITDVPQKEKNITLVVETSCNKALFEKFPEIENSYNEIIEKHNLKKNSQGDCVDTNGTFFGGLYINTILVIGSHDGTTINSMKILCGSGIINEIDYVLEFFRRNS